MIRLFITTALTLAAFGPGTRGADTPSKKGKSSGPVIAHIKLAGDLDEGPVSPDSLFGSGSGENFRTKIERIAKARKDENVKALYLEFGGLTTGFGKLDELRRAIGEFKTSGKK